MSRPTRPLALITGSSRGIGLAIAKHLAADHDLVLTGRNAETLASAASELSSTGATITTVVADLGDSSSRRALIEQLASHDPPVQVLVNNAGMVTPAPLPQTEDAIWAQTIELNLTAPFELARALGPVMAERGWGRIINISSTAGLKGYAFITAYSSSKAGLLGLTRSLAAELGAQGVTVNAVCPGYTDTQMLAQAMQTVATTSGQQVDVVREQSAAALPLGRFVEPDEVAALVQYLAGDGAGSLSGQVLTIDSGETAL